MYCKMKTLQSVTLCLSCSMSDADAEKVSLEPDSISFMKNLTTRDCDQVGLQNGFSPTTFGEQGSDTPGGGGSVNKTSEDEEKSSTPPGQKCPVGLHKAVLLYPTSAQPHRCKINCTLIEM